MRRKYSLRYDSISVFSHNTYTYLYDFPRSSLLGRWLLIGKYEPLFWYQNDLKLKPCRENTSPFHPPLVFKIRVDITQRRSNVLPSITNPSGNFSSISYAAYMYKTTTLTSSPVDKSFSKSSNSIQ